MNWGEWFFVAVCSLVVLAMLGTVNLAAGIVGAVSTGLALWALLALLSGPEEYQRRR